MGRRTFSLILATIGLAWFSAAARAADPAFVHPGLLVTQSDLDRAKQQVEKGASPWTEDWKLLQSNSHDSLKWSPQPESVVVRGSSGNRHDENYRHLFNDIAAAYADVLDWKISGDTAKADKAVQILNAWSSVLSQITGTNDKYLASGIYGYEIANAAEILRTYPGWSPKDFKRFQDMMLRVFYPMNRDFLAGHNNAAIDHYWANWDLANDASMIAIGVLTDRRDIYRQAVAYYLHGAGNGSIKHLVWKLYEDGTGQWQESGRDQGHTLLGIGLAGSICQMAWNQGDDLFGVDDNRLLKGAEYVAKYNLGHDVPYTPYTNSDVTQKIISADSRGGKRPTWELIYNHYVVLKGLKAPYVTQYAALVRPEGGGGDYGPNSGGFDALGYGTLTFTLRPVAVPQDAVPAH
ncbi:Alginate lyase [Granulicella rosea]|uniref:Alginate lyase n=1 Tax=Granulicella rosea TaxID=474952 RepID=A0A239LVR1_9BACT|nr:alginate lyase family protein [Granulicella rosea]SNT34475.1 Alginate lyase [Granulicella rosea]